MRHRLIDRGTPGMDRGLRLVLQASAGHQCAPPGVKCSTQCPRARWCPNTLWPPLDCANKDTRSCNSSSSSPFASRPTRSVSATATQIKCSQDRGSIVACVWTVESYKISGCRGNQTPRQHSRRLISPVPVSTHYYAEVRAEHANECQRGGPGNCR